MKGQDTKRQEELSEARGSRQQLGASGSLEAVTQTPPELQESALLPRTQEMAPSLEKQRH